MPHTSPKPPFQRYMVYFWCQGSNTFSERNHVSLWYETHARVAELADALDLGSSGHSPWGFESPLSHFLVGKGLTFIKT